MSYVITGDGSPTLYAAAYGEHYHSTKDGAFTETLHKHVLPAWEYRIRGRCQVTVLDLGFGLGYNSLVLFWLLQRLGYAGRLRIVAVERDAALIRRLPEFAYPETLAVLRPLLIGLAANGCYRRGQLEIRLVESEARAFLAAYAESDAGVDSVDVIFHDPFSPQKNPTLWTRECFAVYRRIGACDLLLTTYSTAAAVRLGLYENGFRIYENRPPARVRSATLASLAPLPLPEIDMELKKIRNPAAQSLRD
jgi:tRNA U34 5-methylaminomethyl-2-thiouridine-forming methyltransferase MnmC